MNKAEQIKELEVRIRLLEDEYDALVEETQRLEFDDPEQENLQDQIDTLEITIGELEEELELLR